MAATLLTEPKTDAAADRLCVNTIRTLSIDAVQQANSGHPGTPMALAPLVYTLASECPVQIQLIIVKCSGYPRGIRIATFEHTTTTTKSRLVCRRTEDIAWQSSTIAR